MEHVSSNRLIEEVEARPTIWDANSAQYNIKKEREKCWLSLGSVLLEDWNELNTEEREKQVNGLKSRWKNLKDYYRKNQQVRSSQPNVKRKKYGYEDKLQFLNNTKMKRTITRSYDKNNHEPDPLSENEGSLHQIESLIDSLPPTSNEITPSPSSSKRRKKPQTRSAIQITPSLSSSNRPTKSQDRTAIQRTSSSSSSNRPTSQDMIEFQRTSSPSSSNGPTKPQGMTVFQSSLLKNLEAGMSVARDLRKQETDSDRCYILSILEDYRSLPKKPKMGFSKNGGRFFFRNSRLTIAHLLPHQFSFYSSSTLHFLQQH